MQCKKTGLDSRRQNILVSNILHLNINNCWIISDDLKTRGLALTKIFTHMYVGAYTHKHNWMLLIYRCFWSKLYDVNLGIMIMNKLFREMISYANFLQGPEI